MARRSTLPPEPVPANLSSLQIQESIPKLERRLDELEKVQIESWNEDIRNDLDMLQKKTEETLSQVFGKNTAEYDRYKVESFNFRVSMNIRGTPEHEWIRGYQRAVANAVSNVKTAIEMLNERLDDMGVSPTGQTLRAYDGLDLHAEIDRAAGQLYRNGHYANAIEDAVKALNNLVRLRSGVEDKDGTALMEQVFSPKGPVLKFNQLQDQSDRDEQRGFMMMFSGAVAGLRNPRAHNLIEDDPERSLEFVAFVSLLAKLLDGATKT